MMKKIIVVFKTHLDVGFTYFAEKVVDKYITSYIPQALKVAKETRKQGNDRFVWTTGSWLIDRFLKRADQEACERMAEAIREGDISWHGLPFTTHTEMMNTELFQYGLSLSEKLDKRFGKKTIAAKMTDVPGHTRGLVPLMADAGIEFLHIGVNPASTAPDVPDLFRWQCGGKEITVMYNKGDYGQFTPIGNTGTAVYFAHTGDNCGPQSAEAIGKMYSELRKEYPGAEIVAGDLNDVAMEVRKLREELPVVTEELGDSWIHGTSSNPKRVSQYRGMLRLAKNLSKEEQEAVYESLLMVPEHTWGLDEKIHLNDHHNMVRADFEKARQKIGYQLMELSWKEQNGYVRSAAETLAGEARVQAERVMAEYKILELNLEGFDKIENPTTTLQCGDYKIGFQENGALNHLSYNGRVLADEEHLLGDVLYELFSENEHSRFVSQYVISDAEWAVEDFGKIGVEEAISEYHSYRPKLTDLYQKENKLAAILEFPAEARELFGAPERAALYITLEENQILFDFAWWDKHANRTPEAFWIGMNPNASGLELVKLGQNVNPADVIYNGGRQLHGIDLGVKYNDLSIESLDAGTVAVEKTSLWNFSNEIPDAEKGVWFNLYNNVWGTNFTMWYDEDARYRFVLRW